MHTTFFRASLVLCILFTLTANAATTRYVNIANTGPATPFTTWETAATNIQDAIDVAVAGDEVIVTNGVYATGGRALVGIMTNRVAIDKAIILRSLNGPEVTFIRGYKVPNTSNGNGAIRCVYLTNGAVLSGFTLTNGATVDSGEVILEQCGGGACCARNDAVLSNCVLILNSAASSGGGAFGGTLNGCTIMGNSASYGGGTHSSTNNNCTLTANSASSKGGGTAWGLLNNCILRGNQATQYGGGSYYGTQNNCLFYGNNSAYGGGAVTATLNNCTLFRNSATSGGGVMNCVLNNCIIYYNTHGSSPNYYDAGPYTNVLNFCCTWPMPMGTGNITNEPLFLNPYSYDLRLQSNSPCINAGNNVFAPSLTGLDDLPRIALGTVDIGAYEYQGSGSLISYAWLRQYGLSNDGSADYIDSDGDRLNNWQEWKCATDPTNSLSVLRLLSPQQDGTNIIVRWQSATNVNYFLERATKLEATNIFSPLAENVPGQTGTSTFTDTNAAALAPVFYRLGVR